MIPWAMRLGELEAQARRANAFDALRLLAALAVVFGHSWSLAGRGQPLIAGPSFDPEWAGHLGVAVFFAISGYLVAASWDRDPQPIRYVLKRALRLLPALLVLTLIVALVVGGIETTVPVGHYLRRSETYRFVWSNVTMRIDFDLPGVFSGHPDPSVDGSLWTLPVEPRADVVVLILGLLPLARRYRALAYGLLSVALLALTFRSPHTLDRLLPPLAPNDLVPAIEYLAVFASASLLYLGRDRVPVRGDVFTVAVAVWAATIPFGVHRIATVLLLPYIVVCIAYRYGLRMRLLTSPGDASYGLYIWGFVVQQIVVGFTRSPWVILLVSAPVAYALGLASWRVIEKPSLSRKALLYRHPG